MACSANPWSFWNTTFGTGQYRDCPNAQNCGIECTDNACTHNNFMSCAPTEMKARCGNTCTCSFHMANHLTIDLLNEQTDWQVCGFLVWHKAFAAGCDFWRHFKCPPGATHKNIWQNHQSEQVQFFEMAESNDHSLLCTPQLSFICFAKQSIPMCFPFPVCTGGSPNNLLVVKCNLQLKAVTKSTPCIVPHNCWWMESETHGLVFRPMHTTVEPTAWKLKPVCEWADHCWWDLPESCFATFGMETKPMATKTILQ